MVKQSGGELALVFPDGVNNTEVELSRKWRVGKLKNYLQPSMTADATLTGIDNKIVMNGIVTSLGLEMLFNLSVDANNQKNNLI